MTACNENMFFLYEFSYSLLARIHKRNGCLSKRINNLGTFSKVNTPSSISFEHTTHFNPLLRVWVAVGTALKGHCSSVLSHLHIKRNKQTRAVRGRSRQKRTTYLYCESKSSYFPKFLHRIDVEYFNLKHFRHFGLECLIALSYTHTWIWNVFFLILFTGCYGILYIIGYIYTCFVLNKSSMSCYVLLCIKSLD